MDDKIKEQAAQFLEAKNLLLIGRGYTFANCLEGSKTQIITPPSK